MTATETTPDPVIRELAPDRLDDFLRFFDRDAFTDNTAWASCYGQFYHLACSDEARAARGGVDNRAATSALIRQGRARGRLAYAGDRLVGWCHATPRHTLPRLARYDGLPPDDGDVGAIVCFVVAPASRRHVVSRQSSVVSEYAPVGSAIYSIGDRVAQRSRY
ncbi:MAG TPA: hypothetical protein VFW96_17105 [Thermomicrobiales bacterium]|nr:hypothetical protein [Thermomicrobiales bacterium]